MFDAPGLAAYLARDPELVTATRNVLETADLAAFAAVPEGLDRLAEAVEALRVAVTDAGVKPELVPAAAAALITHVHRADTAARPAVPRRR